LFGGKQTACAGLENQHGQVTTVQQCDSLVGVVVVVMVNYAAGRVITSASEYESTVSKFIAIPTTQ
jgi:hypothetical protein